MTTTITFEDGTELSMGDEFTAAVRNDNGETEIDLTISGSQDGHQANVSIDGQKLGIIYDHKPCDCWEDDVIGTIVQTKPGAGNLKVVDIEVA